jgi:hypothetical protein
MLVLGPESLKMSTGYFIEANLPLIGFFFLMVIVLEPLPGSFLALAMFAELEI